jgi:hypothetical protein
MLGIFRLLGEEKRLRRVSCQSGMGLPVVIRASVGISVHTVGIHLRTGSEIEVLAVAQNLPCTLKESQLKLRHGDFGLQESGITLGLFGLLAS